MLTPETAPPPADDPWVGCNPFDPAFRDDPYPSLARLREIDPVNEMPVGIWRLTRYADVNRLLHDVPAGVRTTDGVLPGVDESLTGQRLFMLQQDPPTHTRLRRLVSSAFTPRAIAALRPQIQRIVDGCLDRVAGRGTMDVIADLALPVPATVICEMLGVPVADRDRFTVWTSKATLGLASQFLPPETLAEVQAAGTSLAAYFDELIAARRGHLSEDLLSALIRAEEAAERPPGLRWRAALLPGRAPRQARGRDRDREPGDALRGPAPGLRDGRVGPVALPRAGEAAGHVPRALSAACRIGRGDQRSAAPGPCGMCRDPRGPGRLSSGLSRAAARGA